MMTNENDEHMREFNPANKTNIQKVVLHDIVDFQFYEQVVTLHLLARAHADARTFQCHMRPLT